MRHQLQILVNGLDVNFFFLTVIKRYFRSKYLFWLSYYVPVLIISLLSRKCVMYNHRFCYIFFFFLVSTIKLKKTNI